MNNTLIHCLAVQLNVCILQTRMLMSHRQHWHSSTSPRFQAAFLQTPSDCSITDLFTRENFICNLSHIRWRISYCRIDDEAIFSSWRYLSSTLSSPSMKLVCLLITSPNLRDRKLIKIYSSWNISLVKSSSKRAMIYIHKILFIWSIFYKFSLPFRMIIGGNLNWS